MLARRRWCRRVAGVVGVCGVLLAVNAQGEIIHFAALLDGICAGSGVSAKGWGSFRLDTITGELTYRVDFDQGLQTTFAHIHIFPDACGNAPSGPIIVHFNPQINPMVGTETLSAQSVEEMKAGNTYANIHTVPFPDGEIAGVIYPIPMSRYISFFPSIVVAQRGASMQAIRLRLTSLHHPDPAPAGTPDFSAFEGEYRWVGAPSMRNDISGPNPTYQVAQLQCAPEFRDWSSDTSLIYVFGAEIVPSSVYEVQFVDDTCLDLDDPACYSDPVPIRTARWGDVVQPFAERAGGQPNFGDVSATLDEFRGVFADLSTPRADLVGTGGPGNANVVNQLVNFSDGSAVLDAFRGSAFPFGLTAGCP
jgi:hypothetical protein